MVIGVCDDTSVKNSNEEYGKDARNSNTVLNNY